MASMQCQWNKPRGWKPPQRPLQGMLGKERIGTMATAIALKLFLSFSVMHAGLHQWWKAKTAVKFLNTQTITPVRAKMRWEQWWNSYRNYCDYNASRTLSTELFSFFVNHLNSRLLAVFLSSIFRAINADIGRAFIGFWMLCIGG